MDKPEGQSHAGQNRREFLTKVAITAPAVTLLVSAAAKKAHATPSIYSDFNTDLNNPV
jgi:hypothetical protein